MPDAARLPELISQDQRMIGRTSRERRAMSGRPDARGRK
jgi:hypothetical protein